MQKNLFLIILLFIIFISIPLIVLAAPIFLATTSIEKNKSDVKLEFNYSGVKKVKAFLDNKEVTAKIKRLGKKGVLKFHNLSDGKHLLELRFKYYLLPWQKTIKYPIYIDTTPPLVVLESPEYKDTYTRHNHFKLKGTAELEATLNLITQKTNAEIIKEKLYVDKNSKFEKDLFLNIGENNFSILAKDKAGNEAIKDFKIILDPYPPLLLSPFPPNNKVIQEYPVEVYIYYREPISKIGQVNFKIDGKEVPVIIQKDRIIAEVDNLWEGEHSVQVTVEDKAGNRKEKSWEFLLDTSETLGDRDLGYGARGEDVRELQYCLYVRNYLRSDQITGYFGQETQAAVRLFQQDKHIFQDGVVGQETFKAMENFIVVDLSKFTLTLFIDGKEYKQYSIACGQKDYPTPTGKFYIVEKVKNPTWIPPNSPWAKEAKITPPGPANPLGTRWLGLNSNIVGIHGTYQTETLGTRSSHGCVRMSMPDIEEVFNLVELGAPVIIKGEQKVIKNTGKTKEDGNNPKKEIIGN